MKSRTILGDCLEEMKKMEDDSIDLIFTSPPYNDSGNTEKDKVNKRHFKYETKENRDDWFEWQVECLDEMFRITKRQIMYNIQPILNNKADVYRLIGKYADKIDNILIWYKPNAQPQHYPHRIANYYEMIIIFKCKKFDKLYINSSGYKNVIVKNINNNKQYSNIHRAVMNENLADEIIREFSLPNDIVLDPFMGLGTTGIACVRNQKDFIGIEIYKPYYDLAKERINMEEAQTTIFDFI